MIHRRLAVYVYPIHPQADQHQPGYHHRAFGYQRQPGLLGKPQQQHGLQCPEHRDVIALQLHRHRQTDESNDQPDQQVDQVAVHPIPFEETESEEEVQPGHGHGKQALVGSLVDLRENKHPGRVVKRRVAEEQADFQGREPGLLFHVVDNVHGKKHQVKNGSERQSPHVGRIGHVNHPGAQPTAVENHRKSVGNHVHNIPFFEIHQR